MAKLMRLIESPIRRKIILLALFSALIPLLVIGPLTFIYFSKVIENKVSTTIDNFLTIVDWNINAFSSNVENLSNDIFLSNEIQSYLTYKKTDTKLYRLETSSLENLNNITVVNNPYINRIEGGGWEDSNATGKIQASLERIKSLLVNRKLESFIYTIDSEIVIMFSNAGSELGNDLVQDLVSLIHHDMRIRPMVGISNIYETISDIKKAYSEAKEALKNGIFSNQSITYYKELETFNHSFCNCFIEKIDSFFNEKGPDLLSGMNLFMDTVFLDCQKTVKNHKFKGI